MKSLIITGNGLGRAIDNDWFNLSAAIKRVWESEALVDADSKAAIRSCIPLTRGIDIFEGEDDLDLLHRARVSCGVLRTIAPDENPWLSPSGLNFPERTAQFITHIAASFQNTGRELPNSFIDPLVSYLQETKSHIATLNYDDLLYIPLIDRGVLNGFSTLVDGFFVKQGGFAEDNLKRKNSNDFGYYLHLHGSPLFVRNNKLAHSRVGEEVSEHIVLTHIKHKREVISSSDILSTYWSYLDFALSEVSDIVVLGYGGLDDHLNDQVSRYASRSGIKIRVIERRADGSLQDRSVYWRRALRCEVQVIQLDSILSFNNWKGA